MADDFKNYDMTTTGLNILRRGLARYIAFALRNEFGKNWWQVAVLDLLREEQKLNLRESGKLDELIASLDILNCLTLLADVHWNDIFRIKLTKDHRTWANEIKGVRHKVAHIGGDDLSDEYTWRALNTMSLLDDRIDPKGAEEIRTILRTLRYGSAAGSTAIIQNGYTPEPVKPVKKAGILENTPSTGLPNWREVIEPHPDVSQGRYKNAEFAADLAQVARGDAAFEYNDPVEFFARTYVTEGMKGLLEQALRRVAGKDGEPVIQLKTAFGGGKTHSLLALYHMLRGKVSIDKMPAIKPVLEQAGMAELPKGNVAVLVGTALDPSKSRRPVNMPGITINTYWGEMASQLAASAGKPELYDYVKEADKKGVSPGSEALKNLFDEAGPSVILMDEIVAYAKKLHGAKDLPAGTFDNFITFIQEVTEAARASKNSLVVASIPESDIEIGGEAGQVALQAIEHTFGRMESIWKPVTANEGFEVVRRRLFLDCKNPEARDAICTHYSRMYMENPSDFPPESKELDYRERMIACYPIHPEVFDRLYNDWATLDKFQRTRGVLRLMAAVIYELWMGNDGSLMIMPGSFPLDVPNVKNELTRYLEDSWNAIVDGEVDGKASTPYKLDQNVQRYGRIMAARRVARTIMLGSAPSVQGQSVRGIESSRIRLGAIQPGENIAVFNDALSSLNTSLSYLYSNSAGNRFWYDTRPTLRKIAEDRATQQSASDVEFEIEGRLRKQRRVSPLEGLHVCPGTSLDVPDDQATRLVILKPEAVYDHQITENLAITHATEILNNRGNSPRIFRNMLAFVAPDKGTKPALEDSVRRYLAWVSIKNDSEILNLDASQNREAQEMLKRSSETVDIRINETYAWLLIPRIDRDVDLKEVIWDPIHITGGQENIVTKTANKMLQNEAVITKWGPQLLKMELDKLLWKDSDHIQIKQLWDNLCTYLYLPRLASSKVLEDTIAKGLNSTEYFGYAEGFDGERYVDLKFNTTLLSVERSGLLVKKEIAQKQLDEENKGEGNGGGTGGGIDGPDVGGGGGGVVIPRPPDGLPGGDPVHPSNRRFYMSADLDNTRIGRDVQRLVDEIVKHLMNAEGSQVQISLEVNATSPSGYSQEVVRTVTENCQTLKVRLSGFFE